MWIMGITMCGASDATLKSSSFFEPSKWDQELFLIATCSPTSFKPMSSYYINSD